ncbi:hypothetical protein HK105_207586 [Polyrhizophydium stewartii]|uniref:Major facilitator superfamily (MFS) profile domain-containing protein n=1 Tax=Polyrhizophydium stewartii TaxID=2732419 RepID=A0ABR4N056_9FUNG
MSKHDSMGPLLDESRQLQLSEDQGSLGSNTLPGSVLDLEVGVSKEVTALVDDVDPSSAEYVKVRLSRIQFVLVYISLGLSIFLASLDQTIVTTALPAIVKELKSFDQISWIGTAFFITSTAFTPLYGKLADIFGRKFAFLSAILVFEAGSLLCGIATSMNVLIVGRAVAGVGGGGIMSLVLIIISDIVSFRDRGKYQGIVGAIIGLSAVIGPLLGGAFTDGLSWRWCFYINLPIGGVAVAIVAVLLRYPPEPRSGEPMSVKLRRIDYFGMALILGAVICLQIPLDFGGDKWAWMDWRTIFMFDGAALLFIAFGLIEAYVAIEPLLPPAIFRNATLISLLVYSFLYGASFFGLLYYLPTYFQLVNGDTATQSGLSTMPLLAGVAAFSVISGVLVSRFGQYKPLIFGGAIVLCVGAGLISTFGQHTSRAAQIIFQIISGCGIGCLMQMRVIGIQASVAAEHITVATSGSTFFASLGGSIGVGIVGAVFKNVLHDQLNPHISEIVANSPTAVRQLPQPMLDQALDGFSTAFQTAYKVIIPLSALIVVCGFFIKPVPIVPGEKREYSTVVAE